MTTHLDTSAPTTAVPPRLPYRAIDSDALSDLLARTVVRDGRPLNLFFLLAHHPELLKRWNAMGAHLLNGELPPFDREVVILRTAWRVQSDYEFGQHTILARTLGFTEEQIVSLTDVIISPDWAPQHIELIRLADQLFDDDDVDDELWSQLAARWAADQLVEMIVLSGYYRMVGSFMRTLRLPRESGVPGFPDQL